MASTSSAHKIDTSALTYAHRYVPCNLCGSESWELVAEKDRHNDPLHTAICKDCGLVFTNPMPTPEAIAKYYSKDYRAEYKGVTQPKFKHIYRAGRMALERLLRILPILKSGQTLVDMGSGGGEFVYLIHKLGLDVWGVEPNEGYAAYSRQEYDLPVQTGFWQTAEFAPASIDVLTAHHVVEHFDDPQAAFHRFAEWVKPNGYLVIDVPNVESDNHAPEKKFHFAHLYNFSPYTLKMMAAKAGFEVSKDGISHGTVIVFQKTGKKVELVKSKENYERVHAIATQRTALDEVVTKKSVFDLFRRLKRQLHEKNFVRRFSRGRDILDATYAHIKPLPK